MLTDVWSGHSLLRSLYPIPDLVADLRRRGFSAVALTDWKTLAGAEEFERFMREAGLTPYLGVSRSLLVDGYAREIRLIAISPRAWPSLVRFSQWTPDQAGGDVALVLGQSDTAWWRALPPLRGPVVVELDASQQDLIGQLPAGWFWVPHVRVRYPKSDDQGALSVLADIGGLSSDPRAQALPESAERFWASFSDWPQERRWVPPEAPSGLLDRGWKMPEVGDFSALSQKALAGLKRRYGNQIPEPAARRLQYELQVIHDLGFPGYFLMVHDVVSFAKRAGIRVGPGRGSAAGSLVAYALAITEVNPLEYGLVFERFLNPARRTLPDIDLDFEDRRRGEVLEYLRQRFGADRVAQIGTYGTLGARAVLRDVARVMKLPLDQVNGVLKAIDWQLNDRLADHAQELERLVGQALLDPAWLTIAQRLEGLPRHRSTHAAGVIIAPEPLDTWVYCHGDRKSGLVTDFDMGSLERLGFVKLDVLGLRTLSLIAHIEDQVGLSGDTIGTVPGNDARTLRLLARGDTDGVFQLDGRGVKRLLQQMEPTSREEVMLVLALYRPGPMDMIGEFLKRRGAGYRPPADDPLAEILRDTYGVMVFQEQLMAAVQQLAGLSLSEADLIRRAISKKNHALLDREGERVRTRMAERGFSPAQAKLFWDRIQAFGDYGFNKSHAASYGFISYYQAWLKAHYPSAFWAAELSSREGDRLFELLRQAMSQGLEVVRPHINQSDVEFRLEGDQVRAGLGIIRGLGPHLIHQIVEERTRGGPFQRVEDIGARLPGVLVPRAIEMLAKAGALDGLGEISIHPAQQMSLFEAEEVEGGGTVLPDDESAFGFRWPTVVGPVYIRLADPTAREKVAQDVLQVLDHYPGTVPVAIIDARDRAHKLPAAVDFHWKAIDAIKDIPGVLAAGRRVVTEASSARP